MKQLTVCVVFTCLAACGGGGGSSALAPAPTYTIGGTVTGLTGTGLVLQNNAGNNLAVPANGAFTFSTMLASGSAYAVTVQTQPMATPAQTCAVTVGSGNVANAAVTNVVIACRNLVGHFLYVPNTGSGTISGYSIDPSTGALTPLANSPFAGAGLSPRVAYVTGAGKFLYVAGQSGSGPTFDGSLAGFTIDGNTGALTPISGLPLAMAPGGVRIRFHPSGNSLAFITTPTTGTSSGIHVYGINATTGALTEVTGSPFAAGAIHNGGTYDASGSYFYAAQVVPSNAVMGYSVSPTTGVFTPSGSNAVTSGSPNDVIVDASNHLYVTTINPSAASSNTVHVYNISATTGMGNAVAGSPFLAGPFPFQLVPTRSWQHLYVLNAGLAGIPPTPGPANISAYSVNTSTGVLTAVSGAPFATGTASPAAMSLDPTGRYLATPSAMTGLVAAFTVNSTSGVLTPVPGSPFAPAVGTTPTFLAFDPSGRFAYLTDSGSNSVSAYSINAVTDTLTLVNSVTTGTTPQGSGAIVGLQ
jgi:6-phosphogluconolactonase